MSCALTTALSAILPRPEQTLLLRASLLSGSAANDAWEEWKNIVGDAKAAMAGDRSSVKRLLPPLYDSLRANGASVAPDLMPYLKLAYVRELMRSNTYRRVCGEVIATLNGADIESIVLRGAPLATCAYPDPALRHCHDLSILVREADLARAVVAITASGRTQVPVDADEGPAALLRDETNLPIEIHTSLFRESAYHLDWNDVFPRAEPITIGGAPTRMLAPEDALIHVCVHASYSASRDSLRWVGDAWHLIRVSVISWDELVRTASVARAELPLFIMLRYVAREMGAPIPGDVLRRLEVCAHSVDGLHRDVALRGARAGECESLGLLFARMENGVNARALTMFWLLFPSRDYVRHVVGSSSARSMVAHYLQRPYHYAARFLNPAPRATPAREPDLK